MNMLKLMLALILLAITQNASAGSVKWKVSDRCNDGYRVDYKFYDDGNDLVWPAVNRNYYTKYYKTVYTHKLACKTGAQICIGGNTGDDYWGVSLYGGEYCSNCCAKCNGKTYTYNFGC